MYPLDKKNQKLLSALVRNCRTPATVLSRQTALSKEVVLYRIKSLEKEEIIKGYTVDINFNRLGFLPYSMAIKLHNSSEQKEKEIIQFISSNKKYIFLQKTLSKYDFVCTLLVKTIKELDKELSELKQLIGKNLKEIEIDAVLGDYDFLASFFAKQVGDAKTEINFLDHTNYQLEKEDEKILFQLVQNSRQTALEISKKTNLSVFTIARRIKKLTKEGIILAFRPIIDLEKLDWHRYSLLVNIIDKEIDKELIHFCRNHPHVWDIGKFIGNYNYAIEILARDNEQFKKAVEEIIGNFSNYVIDYETLIIIKELKHNYFFL